MSTSPAPHIPWIRATTPEGMGSVPSPDRRPLGDLRAVPVVVLLGERGSGKSDVLAEELKALTSSGTPAYAAHLGDFDSAAELRRELATFAPGNGTAWHVLLDGFDQAGKVRPLLRALQQWQQDLNQAQHTALRLRIASRPGNTDAMDAMDLLRKALAEGWAPEQVQFRRLERLTAEAIAAGARAYGLDPAAFHRTLHVQGLQALASTPVTLVELLRDQVAGRALPTTFAQAYARFCDRLLHETGPDRPPGPDVHLLLQAAMTAAAALHLCTEHPFLTGRVDAQPHEGLRISDLAGTATPEMLLRHLLGTGLFQPVDEHRYRFARRDVQEYLASEYLRERRTSGRTLTDLLLVGTGLARHPHPLLRDLASWIAAWNPETFDELLACDPAALLSSDLTSDRDRERLVDALLEHAPTANGVQSSGYTVPLLHRIAHPALRDQLARHLHPIKSPGPDRAGYSRLQAALTVAQSVDDVYRPAGALLTLAEDQGLSTAWRAAALHALPQSLDAQQVQRVRALSAVVGQGADEIENGALEEVAVAALDVLWPAHLALGELLDRLATVHDRWIPSLLSVDLTRHQLLDLLAWARQQLTGPSASEAAATSSTDAPQPDVAARIGRAGQVLALVLDHAAAAAADAGPDVVLEGAAADLLAALAARDDIWGLPGATAEAPAADHAARLPERLREPLPDEEQRRRLAGLLLDRVAETDLSHAIDGPFRLFPPTDRPYWAIRFTGLDEEARDALEPVLRRGADRPLTPDEQSEIARHAAADQRVARIVRAWTAPGPAPVPVGAPRTDLWRFDVGALAAELHRRPAANQVRKWWEQTATLIGFRTLDGTLPHPRTFSHLLDITASPAWPAAAAQHTDLAHAARWALQHAPAITAGAASSRAGLALDDVPELRALPILGTPPATLLGDHRWAGIAVALLLIQLHPDQEAARTRCLHEALAHAGSRFDPTLRTFLDRLPPQAAAEAVTRLATASPDRLATATAWARDTARDHSSRTSVLRALAAAGTAEAVKTARNDAAALPVGTSQEKQTWAAAVNVALEFGDTPEQDWKGVLTDPARTSAWIEGTDTFDPTMRMTPRQVGFLYDHVNRLTHTGRSGNSGGNSGGAGAMTTARRLALSKALIDSLALRQPTPEIVAELRRLAARHSAHHHLSHWALHSAQQLAELQWCRPSWPVLREIATDPRLRTVDSSAQLAQVVLDVLDDIQTHLTGPNGLAPLLWNRTADRPGKKAKDNAEPPWVGWPMWEQDLTDLVRHLLTLHLAGRRVVVNREVQIDRDGRLDLKIEALPQDPHAPAATVIIEVKGCWNKDLANAAELQLVRRYLERDRGAAGIYLVGYFDSPTFWRKGKRPGADGKPVDDRPHRAHTIKEIEEAQQKLVLALRAQGFDVHVAVLDCRPDPVEQLDAPDTAST
ncbi:hypothetical protein [Kitasatospora sp. NPDC088783]|uniref:hypothetical protein n=1 Tax=Kitasatospora sp. NPDC088783 TaxID=3364077 RepID=UPI0037F4CF74